MDLDLERKAPESRRRASKLRDKPKTGTDEGYLRRDQHEGVRSQMGRRTHTEVCEEKRGEEIYEGVKDFFPLSSCRG